jgi:hypothetical protein
MGKYSYHYNKTTYSQKTGESKALSEEEIAPRSDEAFQRIEKILAFKFISYMAINWYRVKNTRRSKAERADVINRRKKYFTSLLVKDFQKLFSG